MAQNISIETYKEQVETELLKRVGISIDDTSEESVEACYEADETPTECV